MSSCEVRTFVLQIGGTSDTLQRRLTIIISFLRPSSLLPSSRCLAPFLRLRFCRAVGLPRCGSDGVSGANFRLFDGTSSRCQELFCILGSHRLGACTSSLLKDCSLRWRQVFFRGCAELSCARLGVASDFDFARRQKVALAKIRRSCSLNYIHSGVARVFPRREDAPRFTPGSLLKKLISQECERCRVLYRIFLTNES